MTGIPLIAEKFADDVPLIVAAFRPHGNGFGRKTGWMSAVKGSEVHVSRSALGRLREQGYTKVRLRGKDEFETVLNIKDLLDE